MLLNKNLVMSVKGVTADIDILLRQIVWSWSNENKAIFVQKAPFIMKISKKAKIALNFLSCCELYHTAAVYHLWFHLRPNYSSKVYCVLCHSVIVSDLAGLSRTNALATALLSALNHGAIKHSSALASVTFKWLI